MRTTGEQVDRRVDRRVAVAPISWGVCEVPGWGYQLDPLRVLAEMRALGVEATELGPEGFFPPDPREAAGLLARYGLYPIGGFVALCLHGTAGEHLELFREAASRVAAVGAGMVILAAATGREGYDSCPVLDARGWGSLLSNLESCQKLAAELGLELVLHPHAGTMIETPEEVTRVLQSSSVNLCLDTGHLVIGGNDPLELARSVPGRVAHVHLKDADAGWAEKVRAGKAGYGEAVRAGMFRPLGEGDAGIAGVVEALEAGGYQGWYVLEQDTMIDHEPAAGEGPLGDVRVSLRFLQSLEILESLEGLGR